MAENKESKICKICGDDKPLTAFPITSGRAEARVRRGPACKPCKAQQQAKRRKLKIAANNKPNVAVAESEISPPHEFGPKGKSFMAGEKTFYFTEDDFQKVLSVFERLKQWRDESEGRHG